MLLIPRLRIDSAILGSAGFPSDVLDIVSLFRVVFLVSTTGFKGLEPRAVTRSEKKCIFGCFEFRTLVSAANYITQVWRVFNWQPTFVPID